jgi:hypothetical protein
MRYQAIVQVRLELSVEWTLEAASEEAALREAQRQIDRGFFDLDRDGRRWSLARAESLPGLDVEELDQTVDLDGLIEE